MYCSSPEKTAVSRLRMTALCAAWIPAGLPRRAQTATSSWQTVNFRRMASGKSRRCSCPEVQWGADGSEVVTEVTFPFSQLHDYVSPSASVRCPYWLR